MTINASHNLVAYVGNDLTIDCIVASMTQPGDSRNFIRWFKNVRSYHMVALTTNWVILIKFIVDKLLP